jgi:hypothetical protein
MHNLVEHVGFCNVFVQNPGVEFRFFKDGAELGVFGCYWCNEQEMFDFVLFRAAQLLGCGRFDTQLEYVTATVTSNDGRWHLHYDKNNWRYIYDNEEG